MQKIEKYADGEITRWAWARDIEQIPEPFWTSIYYVDGLLIDSGPPAALKDFEKFVDGINSDRGIEKVLLTHWHEDHSGGASYLSEELELPVYIHENGLEKVRNGFTYPDYRKLAWGGPLQPALGVQSINFDTISTKTEKYTFDLKHIPGHSTDLVALIESDEEWAFVSDSIVPRYQMIFREKEKDFGENMEPVQDNMQEIHSSLKKIQRKIADMGELRIFTAASGEFEGQKILSKNIQEIEDLHEKVHEYKNQGLKKEEIVEKIFGEEHPVGVLTDHGLSRLNLIKSLLNWSISE